MLPPGHLALESPGWMVEDTCPPPDLPAEPQPRLSLLRVGGPGRFPFCEAENMLNFRAKAGGGDASGWSFGSGNRLLWGQAPGRGLSQGWFPPRLSPARCLAAGWSSVWLEAWPQPCLSWAAARDLGRVAQLK